jgi:hypothetical protein
VKYLIEPIEFVESSGEKISIQQVQFNGSLVPEEQIMSINGNKTVKELIQSISLTLNDKTHSDLTIKIEKKEFFCHQLILSQW